MSLVGPDRLTLLNETRQLSAQQWDDPAVDRLWRYNLHYFDDLAAPPSSERLLWQRALMMRWVREVPPGAGTGWEPYPTSLRIVNWIKWSLAGNELPPECVTSLAEQTRWLARRLERHLLGNHLFANAKALVFAGLFFDGDEADGWLTLGLAVLAHEIPEQILSDGGQFERSPMYHALAVEDMLDLYNVARAYRSTTPMFSEAMLDDWRARIAGMRRWMLAICHPDGEIGLLNDAAFGIAPTAALLEAYAVRLGLGAAPAFDEPIAILPSTGYVRVTAEDAVALLDVAPIGPDYLPGHAHADTLSFELSLFGHRVVVDSGTSQYGSGAERMRQRGTAAHNTVTVDGEDSSEVWGGFRVARRARPLGLSVVTEPRLVVRSGHDGYRRLPGKPEHWRSWTFSERGLAIEDQIRGRFGIAEARFHFHPDVVVREEPSSPAICLVLPDGRTVLVSVRRGQWRIEATTWHPEFGRVVPSRCLVVGLDEGMSHVHFDWRHAA